LFGAGFLLVDRYLADDRFALANTFAAGHGALDLDDAGNPALDGPRRGRRRTTAVVAAAPVTEPPRFLEAALPVAGAVPALVVAPVHALGNHLGHLPVADALLHDGPLFAVRNADAVGAGHGLDLGDLLVDRAGEGALLGNALALVSGVLFRLVRGLVHG